MVKYLIGKDYSDLCGQCQKAINDAHDLLVMGFVSEEYLTDNEGPCMIAYDKGWLNCRECD